jgi:hypothetical protein
MRNRTSRRPLALLVTLCILLSSAAAEAQTNYDEGRGKAPLLGLQFGARIGYAFGAGDVYSGLGVSDASNGALPLTVDFGLRLLPELYVGLYGSWAHVFTKTNAISCPTGFDCTANDWRFGLEVDYHFTPRRHLDPYIGLSGGYEVLHTDISGPTTVQTPLGPAQGTASASITDRGWEFAALTLGLDLRVVRFFGLGPFVQASINEYGVHSGTQTVTVAGSSTSVSVPDVSHDAHGLIEVGLRGTFNL